MKKYLVQHLIASIIVGIVYFVFAEKLFPVFTEKLWTPFGISLYFVLFAIVLICFLTITSLIRFFKDRINSIDLKNIGSSILISIVLSALILLFSGLFEFIYELGVTKYVDPTSYVFLIDDSGSMSHNDPNYERVDAISRIMNDKSPAFKYAVYGFTDKAFLIKDLSSQRVNLDYGFRSDGNTDILGSLDYVLNDVSKYGNSSEHIRILILSDGQSSSFGSKSVINRCNDAGISVSCVAFGTNSTLLHRIADRTGGQYIKVDDINKLADEMKTAIESSSDRNLLSYRYIQKNDGLYCFLRIVFIVLLGLLWSIIKFIFSAATLDRKYAKMVFVISAILCIASAFVMELITQHTFVAIESVRCVFCILWAITPGYLMLFCKSVEKKVSSDGNGSFKKSSAQTGELIKTIDKTVESEFNNIRTISANGKTNIDSEDASDFTTDDPFSDTSIIDSDTGDDDFDF